MLELFVFDEKDNVIGIIWGLNFLWPDESVLRDIGKFIDQKGFWFKK